MGICSWVLVCGYLFVVVSLWVLVRGRLLWAFVVGVSSWAFVVGVSCGR